MDRILELRMQWWWTALCCLGWSSSWQTKSITLVEAAKHQCQYCPSECVLLPLGGWITAIRSVYYCPLEGELVPLGGWITAPRSVKCIPEMLPEETETFLRKNIAIGCFRRQNSTFIEFISQHWPVSLKEELLMKTYFKAIGRPAWNLLFPLEVVEQYILGGGGGIQRVF